MLKEPCGICSAKFAVIACTRWLTGQTQEAKQGWRSAAYANSEGGVTAQAGGWEEEAEGEKHQKAWCPSASQTGPLGGSQTCFYVSYK